jgi:hypothetical protein
MTWWRATSITGSWDERLEGGKISLHHRWETEEKMKTPGFQEWAL